MQKVHHSFKVALLSGAALLSVALPAHAGKTLEAITARGQLVCGVNPSLQGFQLPTARATGPAWMWTCAKRSPRRP